MRGGREFFALGPKAHHCTYDTGKAALGQGGEVGIFATINTGTSCFNTRWWVESRGKTSEDKRMGLMPFAFLISIVEQIAVNTPQAILLYE